MKKIIFGTEAKEKIEIAVNILNEAIAHTLGPKGGNTGFSISNSTPIITNDGVSIAREIFVKDQAVNAAIQLIKEAAIKANTEAGDGTTTSIVLTKAIFDEGLRLISEEGANAIALRDGMNKALSEILETINNSSRHISDNNDILNVATISSGSKETGEIILEAFNNINEEGIVQVEKGNSSKSNVVSIKGYNIDITLKEDMFLKEKEIKLKNCFVLNTNLDFEKPKQLMSLLQMISREDKPCLLIGNSFSEEVVSNLLINFQRDIVCIPLEAPSFGQNRIDLLEDLEYITNSKLITKTSNIHLELLKEKELLGLLGIVKEAKLKKDLLIFNELLDDSLLGKRLIELKKENADKQRLAKLNGGISTIYVGGLSKIEVDEKYYRVEDAINATNSAIEDGIVPGGGSLLHYISTTHIAKEELNDSDKGYNLVYRILKKPMEVICRNSGIDYKKISEEIISKNNYDIGLNALSGEVCNLIESGILDPTKTVKSSLKAAVSVASTILTTNCLIVNEEEKKSYKNFL